MRETRDGSYYRAEYDSWDEWLEHCDYPSIHHWDAHKDATNGHGPEWTGGVRTFAEAMALARGGWTAHSVEAMRLADSRLSSLSAAIPTFDIYNRIDGGGTIDVGAYLVGVPECYIAMEESMSERKACRILLNMSVHCGISPQGIIKKGEAVVALIQSLELAGIATEVILTSSGTNDGTSGVTEFESSVLIKRGEDYLDVPRLMFALAHPACFRVLGFAWAQGCKAMPERSALDRRIHSYGRKTRLKADIIVEDNPPLDAEAWVREKLVKQGVKLAEAS